MMLLGGAKVATAERVSLKTVQKLFFIISKTKNL